MAHSGKELKTVLQLYPQYLENKGSVFLLLHIEKKGGIVSQKQEQLGLSGIQKHFDKQPTAFHRALYKFSVHHTEHITATIKENFKLQRGGKSYQEFFTASYRRVLHDQFRELKPFLPLIKLYHHIPVPGSKGRFKTAPALFSSYTPEPLFSVTKTEDDLFSIAVHISINGTSYALSSFNRYAFLLESNNEYFLLSYKSYKTIEWLQQLNWQQEGADAAAFVQNIIGKLEEEYKVNRNDYLAPSVVQLEPMCRVLLSEINNAFLVLTPQFDYDGFIVEGNYTAQHMVHRDGSEFAIQRHKETEEAFIQTVEELHPNFSKQLNGYYYLSFAEAQKKHWFLKVYQQLLGMDVQIAGMDMLKHFRYSGEAVQTNLQLLGEENNQLLISLKAQFGKEEIPVSELQKNLRNGQQAVLLKDGSIGILTDEWLRQYSTLIKHAVIEKKQLLVPKWLLLTAQLPATEVKLQAVVKEEWWQKWKQWQQEEKPLYKIPAVVKATLRPYQSKGYEWMRLLQELGAGSCLADDMGLGKTLQTICFIAAQLEAQPHAHVLIVCPASLMYNWQTEFQKFAPSLQCTVYHGTSRNKTIFAETEAQIIISSYGTVRSDEALVTTVYFGAIVLDESHSIKNPSSQITKVVHRLRAASRITLSGTPIMNNTFDLYSQLHFAVPGMLGSREFFKREYADPVDIHKSVQKIAALQKLTAPFILRRTKEQVAKDLPPKTESLLWCQMDTEQQFVYEEVKDQVRGALFKQIEEDGLQKSKLQVLQGIMKLRQICNSPQLLKDEAYNHYTDSIKTTELMEELCNNLSNHKALVFSQFTSMIDLLSKELKGKQIQHLILTGDTPPKERMQLADQFNDPACESRVFLLSLKAGNAGLNLTAADYVFLFDPWWNTAVEQQAIDRTHRIGQTKNVFAYKMICKGTIEERIIQLQQKKKVLSDELITEEDGFVKALSEEDVAFLFS